MLISYAQNFEDILLWRALKHVEHGLYIDVGAQDPVVDSVSRLFYDQGWRGIHVEATTTYANLLREARPDEAVFQVALSDSRGTMTFYEIPDTGISTGDPAIAAQHKERGFKVNETHVPTLRLEDIFSQAKGEIHWLKIDVEGMEPQVLSGWGDAPIKPWIVCIESTLPMTQTESFEAWEDDLLGRGYEFAYFDGLNRYYISTEHLDLREAFVNGPNLFDGFSLSGLASSPFSRHVLRRHAEEKKKLEAFISELNKRIAELEAEPLREAQAMLSARIESLYSEAQRRQDEWTVQERALHGTIADLNVRLLDIQQSHNLSEREALAQITKLREALLEGKLAAAKDRENLRSELHGLELQIANLNHELSAERLISDDLRRIFTSNASTIQELQESIANTREALTAADQQLTAERSRSAARLADLEAAHAALSDEAEQVRKKLSGEVTELTTARDQSAARLADLEAAHAVLSAEAEQVKNQLSFENAELQNRLSLEAARFIAVKAQLSGAQDYIEALRSSTSWRVTGPLRKFSVLLGSKAEGIPNFNTVPEPIVARSAQPSQSANNTGLPLQAFADDLSEMRTAMTSQNHTVAPAQSLKELVRHCDERFVTCAYITLFGRTPDPAGMAYYLDRVRSGDSKHQIVWELSQSAEARIRNVRLAGLITHRPAWRRYASRLRAALHALFGQADIQRQLRIMENEIGRNFDQLRLGHVNAPDFSANRAASAQRQDDEFFESFEDVVVKSPNAARKKVVTSAAQNSEDMAIKQNLASEAAAIYTRLRK